MDSIVYLIDSAYRSTGTVSNFTISFDDGISITPEIIKVLSVIITPQSIPPRNVIYLCSDIIGGYSNGYYDVGLNIQNIIGGYNVIAVIPVTAVGPTVYNCNTSNPYFTCLGTIFSIKIFKWIR